MLLRIADVSVVQHGCWPVDQLIPGHRDQPAEQSNPLGNLVLDRQGDAGQDHARIGLVISAICVGAE